MKRMLFQRRLSFFIAVLITLSAIPISAILAFAETEVSLTSLSHESVTTISGEFRTDDNITIGTETYEKGIYIHPLGAGDANAASITYRIDAGNYTGFAVWVGKNADGNGWGNLPMRFEIHVDGKPVAISGDLQYPDKEKLAVTIPQGAQTLTLVAKAVGTAHYACGAGFGNPILYRNDAGINEMILEKSLTELEYASVSSLFGVSDPLTTQKEGELRINNGIVIGNVSYQKGIYLHPVSSGGSSYITYDVSGKGFKTFRTYVGKDSKGSGYGNNPVRFEIYVDGVKAAESKLLKYPSIEELSLELPADAKELKLTATAVDDYSATGCCFGDPVLTVAAKPGELVVFNKPDASAPVPVGTYTFTGVAYADSVEVYTDGVKSGTAIPDGKGNWSVSVNYPEKINHVIVVKSVIDKVVIQTEMFKFIMNDDIIYASALPVTSWTGLKDPQVYAVNPQMSVGGGGRYRSSYGFQNHPLSGSNQFGAADINIDIAGRGYTYFQTVVGKNDAVAQGGTGMEFIVIADGEILARSGLMKEYEAAVLSADLPQNAQTLTLRVTNYDGSYYYCTGDWIDPILAKGKDKLYSVSAVAYDSTANRSTLDLSEGVTMHVSTNGGLKAVTVPYNESVLGNLTLEVYKYTGSYYSSLKRDPIEKAYLGESAAAKTMVFTRVLDPGEYLIVLKGQGQIDAFASDLSVVYSGRQQKEIAPALIFAFEESASAPFFKKVTGCVGDTDAAQTTPTNAEKAAAKATYDSYLANGLRDFPIEMKIGNNVYNGFGASVFSVISRKTAENGKNGIETETVIRYTPADTEKAAVIIRVRSVYYPEYAAYDWVVYFSNEDEEKDTPVISDIRSKVLFRGEDPYVYGYSGDPTGFIPVNFAVTETKRVIAPEDGRSTNNAFPYWNLEYGNGGALIAVGWAGQWEATYQKSAADDAVSTFTNGQQTFHTYLKPGETARIPLTAIVQYSGRDTDRAVNLWRRFMINCNMPTVKHDDSAALVDPMILGTTHEYFNEMTGTNEQEQLNALQHFIDSGADLDVWWMDAGWYFGANGTSGIGSSWWNTGSWAMDTTRFPTELKAISDLAKQYDIKTMLWFEPERVGNRNGLKSDGSTLRPEWVFDSGLVDYSNPDCVDWLIERILAVLETGDISIYREDFNIGPLSTWNRLDQADPDRAGITENLHIQGHFRLWEAIRERFPDMVLDSCASGGRRNDLETMRYAVPLHRTDQDYGDSSLQQCFTYSMAAWIPYFGSKADSNVPDSTVYRTQYSDKYALRRALVPAMEYNYSPYDPIDWYKVQDAGVLQRALSRYYYSDYYQLTQYTRSEQEWMAWEYYIPEEGHGYANLWRRNEAQPTQRIFLKGLKADAVYDVWFEDRNSHAVYTGADLMYSGILVTLPSYRSNDLMYFSTVGNTYAPYTERKLTVKVTEPSVSTYGGQLGDPVHETVVDGETYLSFALRFNMSIRDTVLSLPVGKGEGYIETDVVNDYAHLITVNGRKLSDLIGSDANAVKMDYDVYNNMLTVYIHKTNAAGFAAGAENTVTLDKNVSTFEGINLGKDITYRCEGNEDSGWKQVIPGDINESGTVTIEDVSALLNILSGAVDGTDAPADLDNDGSVTIKDVTTLLNILAGIL